MGFGASQPEVTASNTTPVSSDGASLQPSRCLMACVKWAGGTGASAGVQGGHGSERADPVNPISQAGRDSCLALHRTGVPPGINQIPPQEGQFSSHIPFCTPERCASWQLCYLVAWGAHGSAQICWLRAMLAQDAGGTSMGLASMIRGFKEEGRQASAGSGFCQKSVIQQVMHQV